jgi:symplekin
MSMDSALKQFSHARACSLQDVSLLSQLMPPIIGLAMERGELPLQRWAARFIAETADAARLAPDEMERLDLTLLPAIRYFLEGGFDTIIWKASIQAAASLYPVVFRHL